MKVITKLLGRVVLPVPSEEVIPKESVYLPDVVDAIADKYHFAVKPDLRTLSPEDVSTKGLVFRLGKLMYNGKETAITDFAVYDLALTVSAHDTDVAQAFVHDVFGTLAEHYEFRSDFITDSRMLLLSELLVQFEDVFDKAVRGFDAISQSLQMALANHYGLHDKYRMNGMSFDFSRELIPQPVYSVAVFMLERRLNRPFKENRYFCRAPFRTPDHIQLLSEIESLFKAK